MNYEELALIAKHVGFTAWARLDILSIELRQEVRDMCAANTCGLYRKNWSCPPGCGTLDECAKRLQEYSLGILVQSCGNVEDSFDFESMMEIEKEHKARIIKIHEMLCEHGGNVLAIGSGGCRQCAECTYPHEPCRFPEKMVSSMEAYGMLVLDVCKRNGLPYYYGRDKMAYTSCLLLK